MLQATQLVGFGGGSQVVVPTTWNSADKDASITLSGGDLSSSTSSGGVGSVRSIASASSGKWYWEITRDNPYGSVGIIGPSDSLASFVGSTAAGYGHSQAAFKYNNGSATAYGASSTTSDIISVALDLDGGTITFWLNGSSHGTAFSGLSGTFHAAVGGISGGVSEDMTANFGATAFSHTPPTGYNKGFGTLS